MKKIPIILTLIALSFILISWGITGHKTVASIAANHLTPSAKQAVKDLLENESLADVASWADEIRNEPEFKATAGWHFVNVADGLNFNEFSKAVKNSEKPDLLKALTLNEQVINDQMATKEQKKIALKFIVHLVGDAHQPMHVSRAEDKGGNTIQVQFDGKGTNLHSLWDSRLLDHQNLSISQLTNQDNASVSEIKKWQNASPLNWLFESYQISSKLYAEVEQNNKIDEKYYQSHISIVNERIEMGGIRLAGLLNSIFKNGVQYKGNSPVINNAEATADVQKVTPININEASSHIGANVSLNSKLYGSKDFSSMILLNLGADYPNQLLTVVLKGSAKTAFNANLYNYVKVKGIITIHNGKPQIIVNDPKQIDFVIMNDDKDGTIKGRK
ncbi:S1/P1 nuclease [Pedobacter nototheniae]|uniref:S1/P1 nuclease n=1 Tax=Pedobacter nototheniae TaxID=2488994 RepID=UPI00292CC8BF|nr:S1/P1 nuclease [Pedobacter nototheniae]